jgi:hypothetical protein
MIIYSRLIKKNFFTQVNFHIRRRMMKKKLCILLFTCIFLLPSLLFTEELQAAQKGVTVKLSVNSSYIGVGDTFIVEKTFSPANARNQALTWRVDNGKSSTTIIKHVSGDKFKAMKMGTATIIGYQKETKKTYKLKVTVDESIGGFHLEHHGKKISTLTIYPKQSILVKVALDIEYDYRNYLDLPFTYSISDNTIAKVDQYGQVTGIKKGNTSLIAKAASGKSVECKLVVTEKSDDIVVNEIVALGMTEPVGYGGYNTYELFLDNDFSKVDDTVLIALPDSELGVFNRIELDEIQKLEVIIYNKEYKVIDTKSLALPYTDWGGIILGTDGCYYVAVGQNNYEESNTKVVFSILKYDREFKELGRCNISDCDTAIAFYASNSSMAMNGTTLVLYTAKGGYKDASGLLHQSSIAFIIDTATMKQFEAYGTIYNRASHSFNQQVKFDHDNLIYVDHGDAYPRAIVTHTYINYISQITDPYYSGETGGTVFLLDIEGTTGDNTTGTRLGGLECGKYNNIVAGISIPHGNLKSDVSDYEVKNIYISLVSKNGMTSEFKWLTNYKEGGDSGIINLRMVKIDDNQFALLYQKYKSDLKSTGLILIDSNGNVLKKKEWNGIFAGNVQPILYQGDIVWVARREKYNELYEKPQIYINDLIRVDLR